MSSQEFSNNKERLEHFMSVLDQSILWETCTKRFYWCETINTVLIGLKDKHRYIF